MITSPASVGLDDLPPVRRRRRGARKRKPHGDAAASCPCFSLALRLFRSLAYACNPPVLPSSPDAYPTL